MKMPSMVAILLLLASSIPSVVKGQSGSNQQLQNLTIKFPCEIILIIDDSNRMGDEEYEKMLGLIHQFPDFFKMGNDSVRVGLIAYSVNIYRNVSLTDDERKVREFSYGRQGGASWTYRGLEAASVLLHTSYVRPGALKMVILITTGKPSQREDYTNQLAQDLKNAGTIIYVVLAGTKNADIVNYFISLAGHESRVIPIDDFTTGLFKQIQVLAACRYEETCYFDNNECKPAWWRPNAEDVVCDNPQPTDRFQLLCPHEKCVNVCESTGKWKECNPGDEGKVVDVERDGEVPPRLKPIIDRCPKTKKITCPSWPRTSTSTETAPGHPGSHPSPSAPGSAPPASIPGPSSSDAVSGPPASPSTPGAPGPSDITASVEHVEERNTQKGGTGELAGWIIPVAVSVGGLALLIAAIAIVVVVMRKKKQAKADAPVKDVADEKKAVKSIGPKSSSADHLILGYKRGASADQAVGVSLTLDPSSSKKASKRSKSSSGGGKSIGAGTSVKAEKSAVGKSTKAEKSAVGKSAKEKSVVAKKGKGK